MIASFSNGEILIRPYEPKDVQNFFSAVRSSAQMLARWMPWCHEHYSIEEAKDWLVTCQKEWAQATSFPFIITNPNTGEVIGSVDLNQVNMEHNFANIGYWISTKHTGKGVATSAVKMIAHFGFSEAGFSRLEIVSLTDNIASRRVAEKAGAKLECIARNRLTGWGKLHDAAVYSLIPTDVTD